MNKLNYDRTIKAGDVDWEYIHSFLSLMCDKIETTDTGVFYYIGDKGIIRVRENEQDISIKCVSEDIIDRLESIAGVKV